VDLFIGDDEDKVTLTVAGKLEVQNGGEVKKATGAVETTIAIPGVVTMSADNAITVDKMTDYVEFTMKVDGKDVHVHSNLAYAAENAVNRDVTIKGDVSGGDVTFTYDGKIQALAIKVPVNSTLTVGTLTLIGDGASIQADKATGTDENGIVTGTIATAAGSVDLVKASNVTLATSVDVDVDGSTDVVTVTGAPIGSFAVASGTVTAATGFAMNATKDNKMSVASDATLVIDSTDVVINGTETDKVYVIVDGTISITGDGALAVTYTTVNGNIDVASAGQLTIGDNSVITGTITVAEKTDDAEAGKAYVNGNLFVGTAPAIGATGTLVGPFTTYATGANPVSGVIVAYPGSDLTGALIDVGTDGKSAAKSTEFYINGQLYMTAVTAEGIAINTFANELGIEIPGLVTPEYDASNLTEKPGIIWYTDENMKTKFTGGNIGSIEMLYTEFDAAEVDLVVSAGVGLKIYIDGLDASEMDDITVGTHTVSFAVESGYDGSAATITVNGVQVSNNGTFTVDADSEKITVIASGAVP
ncbi:MAG: hypothetical protein IKA33_04785, partial [Candidatus Methanomethylophilaceae archaeon]|nr:hypothetical protein [Candidatus Methanomethylophilaceae archaeon]